MNIYQAVELDPGHWAIERLANGASQGFTFGRYEDQAEAANVAAEFARADAREALMQPDTA